MRSGQYRHRVIIERVKSDATTDELGNVVVTDDGNWERYVSINAEIKPSRAAESSRNDQTTHDVSHVVSMPWYPGIDETMRIRFDGRTLNIVGIFDSNEDMQELTLDCVETT